jgi:hypothetical protein
MLEELLKKRAKIGQKPADRELGAPSLAAFFAARVGILTSAAREVSNRWL